MVSSWIEHVKKVASQKKITYKEALKVAGASYKKVDKSSKKEKKEKSKKEEPKKKVSKMEKMASAKLAKDKPKKKQQGEGKNNE